jgi:hypothetical protein
VTGQINSDNSLVITNSLVDGQIYATSTATGADIYSGFQAGAFSWDPDDPLTYYYLTFAQRVIRKHNLATNADSLVYSYPGAAFDLSNGGDGSVNKLKYWCVFTQGSDPTHPLTGHDQTVMIVNLNTGNSYAGSYAGSLIEVGGYNARLCTHKM